MHFVRVMFQPTVNINMESKQRAVYIYCHSQPAAAGFVLIFLLPRAPLSFNYSGTKVLKSFYNHGKYKKIISSLLSTSSFPTSSILRIFFQ